MKETGIGYGRYAEELHNQYEEGDRKFIDRFFELRNFYMDNGSRDGLIAKGTPEPLVTNIEQALMDQAGVIWAHRGDNVATPDEMDVINTWKCLRQFVLFDYDNLKSAESVFKEKLEQAFAFAKTSVEIMGFRNPEVMDLVSNYAEVLQALERKAEGL